MKKLNKMKNVKNKKRPFFQKAKIDTTSKEPNIHLNA